MNPPSRPKLYHITHVGNLSSIIADGGLLSDAVMIARGAPPTSIGMAAIKSRRLVLPVSCHPGDHVGDFVPFYFCPRSIMLYVIHCANHPELTYKDGQGEIVHLGADLHRVVEWAEAAGRRWAFSGANAGARYTPFYADVAELGQINWGAVAARDFRAKEIKEGKQAEFLVHGWFPWELVERVGVECGRVYTEVMEALSSSAHRPRVQLRPDWYY